MSATDNAQLAIDANFDINGTDATYFSIYPGVGIPCRVMAAQPDVEFGLGTARVVQAKSEFMLRGYAEGITPVGGGILAIGPTLYRIKETPVPDDLRLLWRLQCVRK